LSRAVRAVGPGLLAFVVYIVFSGSVNTYNIVTGVVVAAVVGFLTANITVSNPGKLGEVGRLGWLIAYAIRYFFIDEVRAHVDVMRRIVHPRMPINPGIVRVPYAVSSDYAMTTIANSITNTPGTVVVDVDTERKVFYVHWIDVKGVEPEVTRGISRVFEFFASRIFD